MVTTVLLVILFVIYFALLIAGFKKKSSLKLEGILQIVQGALWSLIAIENWAERSMVVRIIHHRRKGALQEQVIAFICIQKDRSHAAFQPTAPVFVFLFLGKSAEPYTTLCKPSVFSISSITPSVATIIMVASAAMVGSK